METIAEGATEREAGKGQPPDGAVRKARADDLGVSRRSFASTAVGAFFGALGLVFLGKPSAATAYSTRVFREGSEECQSCDPGRTGGAHADCVPWDDKCPAYEHHCWCHTSYDGEPVGYWEYCCEYLCPCHDYAFRAMCCANEVNSRESCLQVF